MMQYAPFDIVVVPYPYVEQDYKKIRPALIVRSWRVEPQMVLHCVLMITGATNERWPGDILIDPSAKLLIPSVLRLSKITTVEDSGILRKVSELPIMQREEIRSKLQNTLWKTHGT